MTMDFLVFAREVDVVLTGTDANAQEAAIRMLDGMGDGGDYLAALMGIAEGAAYGLRMVNDPAKGHARTEPPSVAIMNASRIIASLAVNDEATAISVATSVLEAGNPGDVLELLVAVTYETRRILDTLHTRDASCRVCAGADLYPLPVLACNYPGSRPR